MMKSYWKRLSSGYVDAAGRRIDNGTELDIRDVRRCAPTPGEVSKLFADENLCSEFLPT